LPAHISIDRSASPARRTSADAGPRTRARVR
jgi:hypothetical protein